MTAIPVAMVIERFPVAIATASATCPALFAHRRGRYGNERDTRRPGKACMACHKSAMPDQFPGALPTNVPIYRLMVRASVHKSNQFVWEILDDSNQGQCVQASKRTFRSMEDAYNVGKGALEYWYQKTKRTKPPIDLAQEAPSRKSVDREPVYTGSLTSRVYR